MDWQRLGAGRQGLLLEVLGAGIGAGLGAGFVVGLGTGLVAGLGTGLVAGLGA